jgi:hypothetical protein
MKALEKAFIFILLPLAVGYLAITLLWKEIRSHGKFREGK